MAEKINNTGSSLAGVKFGKGCDTDVNITDDVTFDPGQISVIARQKQYNESYDKTADDKTEEQKIMAGKACVMRPATFVGKDLIGDAYISNEAADSTTIAVGGIKANVTKKDLMKDYHGSISEVLDAILFPDADFDVTAAPQAPTLKVNKTSVYNSDKMSVLTFTQTDATSNKLGKFNYAKDKSGNIIKDGTIYANCTDPSPVTDNVTYSTTSTAINTAYNGDTTFALSANGADTKYYFKSYHTLTGYKFTGDNALTPCSKKGLDQSGTSELNGYADNKIVYTNVVSVTAIAPFYGASVRTGKQNDINEASSYNSDEINAIVEQVKETKLNRVVGTNTLDVAFDKGTNNDAFVFLFPAAFKINAVYGDHKGSEALGSMKQIGLTTINNISYKVWTPTVTPLTDYVEYRVIVGL